MHFVFEIRQRLQIDSTASHDRRFCKHFSQNLSYNLSDLVRVDVFECDFVRAFITSSRKAASFSVIIMFATSLFITRNICSVWDVFCSWSSSCCRTRFRMSLNTKTIRIATFENFMTRNLNDDCWSLKMFSLKSRIQILFIWWTLTLLWRLILRSCDLEKKVEDK